MTSVMENGVSADPGAHTPGTAAMSKLSYTDKQFKHTKLVRYLDGPDYDPEMTIKQIAEAVGISHESVRKELRARNGGLPLPRGRKARVHRRGSSRADRNMPGVAVQILTDWLTDNPGTHTLADMERGTGLPKSTVRSAVMALGVIPQPGRKGAPSIIAAYERRKGEAELMEAEPVEQEMTYVSTLQDGTLVGQDKNTGQLWSLVPGRLL